MIDEPLMKLKRCKGCGNTPMRGGVMFMGHHVECCHCGIAIPFPNAPTANAAAIEWNKANEPDELENLKEL